VGWLALGCWASWEIGERARPKMNRILFIYLNYFQKRLDLNQLKYELFLIQKFQIKYVFQCFEIWNNFHHRNFFRFKIYFGSKIWEVKV
jgi:hypothetical protein